MGMINILTFTLQQIHLMHIIKKEGDLDIQTHYFICAQSPTNMKHYALYTYAVLLLSVLQRPNDIE